MFCTAVGSLVEDVDKPIMLVVDQTEAEEATRRLVRIGYDNLVGFVDPETLHAHFQSGGHTASIETIDFAEAERRRHSATVIDVRSGPEYREEHLPQAINAPYTRLPEYNDRVPSEPTLLVHCGSGARASVAAAYLSRTGRKVVVVNDLFSNYSTKHA
jgi:hydroxyacylglutathione hydrolase